MYRNITCFCMLKIVKDGKDLHPRGWQVSLVSSWSNLFRIRSNGLFNPPSTAIGSSSSFNRSCSYDIIERSLRLLRVSNHLLPSNPTSHGPHQDNDASGLPSASTKSRRGSANAVARQTQVSSLQSRPLTSTTPVFRAEVLVPPRRRQSTPTLPNMPCPIEGSDGGVPGLRPICDCRRDCMNLDPRMREWTNHTLQEAQSQLSMHVLKEGAARLGKTAGA
jgi:hypothetical protein